MSCVLQVRPLPLRSDLINDPSPDSSNNISSDIFRRMNSFFYPPQTSANDAIGYGRDRTKPSELMEQSASNYYAASNDDYSTVTTIQSADDFAFEKINPSDIKKINKNVTTSEVVTTSNGEDFMENNSESAQQQQQSLGVANDSQKFSKLLFSSPSAHVSSHGPSGPFKAIICHDCENSEGRNVGHSVSFSAIKSWNVGNSNAQSKSKSEPASNQTYPESVDVARIKAPDKYYESHDENQQIEMNDKVELFKVETVSMASETEKPYASINTWNYSHLPINNENAKLNGNSNSIQKKPIFNDLLKVPYDVLNAPLTETPSPEPLQGTQIHINHQQKFNDTITSNYQHFQQFIQKNLKPTMMQQHYQSTPMPEQNYEVDESVSLMTNGRAHGVQSTTARVITQLDEKNVNLPSSIPQEQEQDAKFGYVVEGRNFRKYRVEEKTADGFIVGEYGLLNNNDGSPIQGVRYTADSNINPRLIYDALLKFLSL